MKKRKQYSPLRKGVDLAPSPDRGRACIRFVRRAWDSPDDVLPVAKGVFRAWRVCICVQAEPGRKATGAKSGCLRSEVEPEA